MNPCVGSIHEWTILRLLLTPYPRNLLFAEGAESILNLILKKNKVGPLDHFLATFRAISAVCRVAHHISDIDILHPFGFCHLHGLFKGFNGRIREMGQFVIREEPGEVNRGILPQILPDPSTLLFDHLRIIV